MAGGSLETCVALIKVAVDIDMTEFPALEAGLVVMRVVMGEGCIVITAGPPDFGVSDSNFFFFGQR